jgi:pilus assembly protein CpaE
MGSGEKIRVLIVDDIAETRENIRKLLQFEPDVEVVGAARSGREAIDLSKEIRPDVVLMDINMPGPCLPEPVTFSPSLPRWTS